MYACVSVLSPPIAENDGMARSRSSESIALVQKERLNLESINGF